MPSPARRRSQREAGSPASGRRACASQASAPQAAPPAVARGRGGVRTTTPRWSASRRPAHRAETRRASAWTRPTRCTRPSLGEKSRMAPARRLTGSSSPTWYHRRSRRPPTGTSSSCSTTTSAGMRRRRRGAEPRSDGPRAGRREPAARQNPATPLPPQASAGAPPGHRRRPARRSLTLGTGGLHRRRRPCPLKRVTLVQEPMAESRFARQRQGRRRTRLRRGRRSSRHPHGTASLANAQRRGAQAWIRAQRAGLRRRSGGPRRLATALPVNAAHGPVLPPCQELQARMVGQHAGRWLRTGRPTHPATAWPVKATRGPPSPPCPALQAWMLARHAGRRLRVKHPAHPAAAWPTKAAHGPPLPPCPELQSWMLA